MVSTENLLNGKEKICVVGLGYVGLPLAVLFSQKFQVIGFDINIRRIEELKKGFDRTGEIEEAKLKKSSIKLSSNPEMIKECKFIVITVPTPIDDYKIPDLTPMKSASIVVGKNLQKDSIVVYESTVYPGVTEEICVPILEKESGLIWKKDFHVGYSPERINPGDKEHTVEKIKKIVSGDTAESLNLTADIYGSVITAGIHRAPTIKTAEAAKVIENTQRDLNIALINELSLIFNRMGIDTKEVLNAAGTKWNFLKFEPGLVGGHCIGVDPYYLTFKAQSLGYHPEVILSGRRINDYIGKYVAENTIKKLIHSGKSVRDCTVLICGLTFKENISDIRNTRVVDIYKELKDYGSNVYVYDPCVIKEEAKEEYGIDLIDRIDSFKPYDAIVLAVKHQKLLEILDIKKYKELSKNGKCILIDIKGYYEKDKMEEENIIYWRL
jgi:UDP-N-acetyl-D-glucosamine/UDP-N-acetyl-D-galactosamine dehydrogenase